MTTIGIVTRRLLGIGTVQEVECDEEGDSVILAKFPNGESVAYPYRSEGERIYAVANAWAELKRRNYVHPV